MTMTDPVADMLTRIRNACGVQASPRRYAAVEPQTRDRARAQGEQLHPGLPSAGAGRPHPAADPQVRPGRTAGDPRVASRVHTRPAEICCCE